MESFFFISRWNSRQADLWDHELICAFQGNADNTFQEGEIMGLQFDVPDYKKIRVIIDTDAACEADDPFAIVHALLSPKLIVKGIIAEHFNEAGSSERSYCEIRTILNKMDMRVPIFMGLEGPVESENSEFSKNEAVSFITEEAMREDDKPLFILCQGAITNVAAAIKANPDILDRITVIWIGTHGEAPCVAPFREFNAGNDIDAANYVLSSGANLWLVPSQVYTTINIGIAEIQRRIRPCGRIGEHLFDQLVRYNLSKFAGWTKGESWSLGDLPAIAIALNPDCGHFKMAKAPKVAADTSSEICEENPEIRIYTDVDSRYILEDMIAKLELFADNKENSTDKPGFHRNPIINSLYTADPAPMVCGDTLYLFTTHDEDRLVNNFYTMNDWRCFSTKNMIDWIDHGKIFSLDDINWADGRAWAPQCIARNGRFYLYCPVHKTNGGMAIAVGVSDSPVGPFKDLGHPLIDEGDWNDIDPTVFIDDDGQAYLYFGNPELRYVLLNEDMISYDKNAGIGRIAMTEEAFSKGSHMTGTSYAEGPWFYRRNGKYYMVYAAFAGEKGDGKHHNEHLAYSTSDSPTGPWIYGGVLMTEEGGTFTNHPGIADFKGHSYLFYHTGDLPGGNLFHRSVCVAEFEYNKDGSIGTIAMCDGVHEV